MSTASAKAEEADDEVSTETKSDFLDEVKDGGVTVDGRFIATTGEGRATRYHEYDPDEVAGFDAVRDDDNNIASQEVANHDEAHVESLSKGDVEDLYEEAVEEDLTVYVGLNATGTKDGDDGDDEDDEQEPIDIDEVRENIADNHDEHGFVVENDEGEEEVVCLVCGDSLGYLVGSHMKSHRPGAPRSIDNYRETVAPVLDVDADDIPLAPDHLMEVFEDSADAIDEETREAIARRTERRWEDGEYDHLRKEDDEDDGEGDD